MPTMLKLVGKFKEMYPGKKAMLILALFYSLLIVSTNVTLNPPAPNIGGIIGMLVGNAILSYLILHIPYFLVKKTYQKADETGVTGWIILLIGFSVAIYLVIIVAVVLLVFLFY